jgi:hypothetical protein
VIAFPQLVTAFLDKASDVDPSKVQIEIPRTDFQKGEEGETPAPPPDFSTPSPK